MPESGQTYFLVNKKSGTAFTLSHEDRRSIVGFTPNKRDDNQKARSTATLRYLPAVDLILICSGSSSKKVKNGQSRTAAAGSMSIPMSRTYLVTAHASLLSALQTRGSGPLHRTKAATAGGKFKLCSYPSQHLFTDVPQHHLPQD